MDVENISLLWPENKSKYEPRTVILNDTVINNLKIDDLCQSVTKNKNEVKYIRDIIITMCNDEDVIRYRQDIFEDILHSKELVESLEEILERLGDLSYSENEFSTYDEITLWKLFEKLKELTVYIECVNSIKDALKDKDIKSQGLLRLRELVTEISEKDAFKTLGKDVDSLSCEMGEIKSLTLGINLDSSLSPSEATLVSVNKTKFKDSSFLKSFLVSVYSSNGADIRGVGSEITKIHKLESDRRRNPLMYHLSKDIEDLLKPVMKDLMGLLKKHGNTSGHFLVNLIPEIIFYLRSAQFFINIKNAGMPICRPEVLSIKERKSIIKDIYNISLVNYLAKQSVNVSDEIVLNDINCDGNGRIFILTGPNRGGKTVYTVAIGLTQVLFQAGVYIPGSKACMSPVDMIYTHFPVDENETTNLGRLGEESKRLNEMFSQATNMSLILLNESLSSTSHTEGLYIAKDVVRALRYLGSRVTFNTHMHELACCVDEINSEIKSDSEVVSLVTGMAEGKRSYKIYQGPPLGNSYARDIAIKHGISYKQLITTINS